MLSEVNLFFKMIERSDFNSKVFYALLIKKNFNLSEVIKRTIDLSLNNLNSKYFEKYLSYVLILAENHYVDYQELFQDFINKCMDKKMFVLGKFLSLIPNFQFQEFASLIENSNIEDNFQFLEILYTDTFFDYQYKDSPRMILINTLIQKILREEERDYYYPSKLILFFLKKGHTIFEEFCSLYKINLTNFLPYILKHFYPDVTFYKRDTKDLKSQVSYKENKDNPYKNVKIIEEYLKELFNSSKQEEIENVLKEVLEKECLRNDKFKDMELYYGNRDEYYASKLATFVLLLLKKIPNLDLGIFKSISDKEKPKFIKALLRCPLSIIETPLPYKIAYYNNYPNCDDFNDVVLNNNMILCETIDYFLNLGLVKFLSFKPAMIRNQLKIKFYEALKTNYLKDGNDLALRIYYDFLTTNMSIEEAINLDLEYKEALKEKVFVKEIVK